MILLRICLRQSLILRDVALDGLPTDTNSAGYLPLTHEPELLCLQLEKLPLSAEHALEMVSFC